MNPADFPPRSQKLNPAGVASIPPPAKVAPEPPPPPSGRPDHVKVAIGLDECVIRAVDARVGRMCCSRTDRPHLDAAHPGYIESALRHAEECDAPAVTELSGQISVVEQQRNEAIERAETAEALLANALPCNRCGEMICGGDRFTVNFFGNQATHVVCPAVVKASGK